MWGASYLTLGILEFIIFLAAVLGAYCFGWLIGSLNERDKHQKDSEACAALKKKSEEIADYSHLRNANKNSKIYYPEILEGD